MCVCVCVCVCVCSLKKCTFVMVVIQTDRVLWPEKTKQLQQITIIMIKNSKYASWCFTPSQPVRLYQGESKTGRPTGKLIGLH